MRHSETITAFFHFSSLYSMKGVFSYVHCAEFILAKGFGSMQSDSDCIVQFPTSLLSNLRYPPTSNCYARKKIAMW
ncbi:hypothetical protein SAMN06265367_1164 [Algoriphagus winogradskyi]|uniref:Uncharacterized protein n=1 Tax=Algoriphagus winogradskyi TaxID=237017 RepID=A0ABY1PL02_9BACT|nr:hypothetical protein SAMN06265367_1164 [Algoriphagus winogradskyi]